MKAQLTTGTLESISDLAKALGDLANRGFALGDIEIRDSEDDGHLLGRLVAHTERGNYVDHVHYNLVLDLEQESRRDLMVLAKDASANN